MRFMSAHEVAYQLLSLPPDEQNLPLAFSSESRYFGIPKEWEETNENDENLFETLSVDAHGYDACGSKPSRTVIALNFMLIQSITSE